VFDCLVVSSRIPSSKRNVSGVLGYPWRVVIDYRTFTYNWCKTEQTPGELMIQSPEDVTLLPAECQSRKH